MARSTFDGPILSGPNRFGDLRNVGYAVLAQSAAMNLTNTTVNTAGYGGGSGQFIDSNGIPNGNGTVFVPSATAAATAQTIPADTATNVYRGFVAYLPASSRILQFTVDVGVLVTMTGGTASLSSQTVYISNNYTAAAGTPTYGATAALSSVGRATVTFSATQLANCQATSTNIVAPDGIPNMSQVVFTLAMVGTDLETRTATTGLYYFSVQYMQADGNIGSTTAYPYGNFD